MAISSTRHKHLKLDQRKIDFARRYFGVKSEQEAIDRAESPWMRSSWRAPSSASWLAPRSAASMAAGAGASEPGDPSLPAPSLDGLPRFVSSVRLEAGRPLAAARLFFIAARTAPTRLRSRP